MNTFVRLPHANVNLTFMNELTPCGLITKAETFKYPTWVGGQDNYLEICIVIWFCLVKSNKL